MKPLLISAVLLAGLTSTAAEAKMRVFACEPEWGSLVHELAGDKVDLDVGTSALQDVHVIEAKPSLIAKVRAADMAVCTGADLEIGWLPQLIRQSGNVKVASGPGSFMAAAQVKTLEKPTTLDRAAGDIHPDGNPASADAIRSGYEELTSRALGKHTTFADEWVETALNLPHENLKRIDRLLAGQRKLDLVSGGAGTAPKVTIKVIA